VLKWLIIDEAGNFAGHFPREVYNMTVTAGKKYLLRIINTSVDTTYIFSIDNHNLTVMSADFVPIKPYNTTNISIGIGQRYHVVLNAVPDNTSKYPASPSGNYWIRAVAADGCSGFEQGNNPDERQGILNYEGSDISIVPVTFRRPYNTTCRDEDSASLVPVLPWTVPPVTMASTAMPRKLAYLRGEVTAHKKQHKQQNSISAKVQCLPALRKLINSSGGLLDPTLCGWTSLSQRCSI
jgi:FtsP/CotA-like multicopper oxidase with cupredoxin domain